MCWWLVGSCSTADITHGSVTVVTINLIHGQGGILRRAVATLSGFPCYPSGELSPLLRIHLKCRLEVAIVHGQTVYP